jgi:hypothetical protein
METKIHLPEKEYRQAKRAIETQKSIRKDVDEIQKKVWKLKNKIKNK